MDEHFLNAVESELIFFGRPVNEVLLQALSDLHPEKKTDNFETQRVLQHFLVDFNEQTQALRIFLDKLLNVAEVFILAEVSQVVALVVHLSVVKKTQLMEAED